jgi:creatinine amidohydrolase
MEWMWDESIPELVDDVFEHNGPHGGPKETAMIQHLAPELVREDRLAAARDDGVRDIEGVDSLTQYGARTFYDAVENSENGVFGDQTDATPEIGERLFEAAVDQLVRLLEWLDHKRIDDLLAPAHVDPQPGSQRSDG